MSAASLRRMITDDLLAVMVRIKREAGVDHADIQSAIDQFASHEHFDERTGGIGFPLVEDIPQNRRDEFMAALAQLMPHTESGTPGTGSSRYVSAVDIWPSRVS